MIKEGAVIAVVGAKRLGLVAASMFWLAVVMAFVVLACYKAFGLMVALGLIGSGDFQAGPNMSTEVTLSVAIIGISLLVAWGASKRMRRIDSLLAIPITNDIEKAARTVQGVEQSFKNPGVLDVVRKALDDNAKPKG